MTDPLGAGSADAGRPTPDQFRPSDADRSAIADRLRRAVDEGRLDLHEYDERLRDAYAAKTFGELERSVADLPQPPDSGPVLTRIGEIAVTATTIYTPVGAFPLRGSEWSASDRWIAKQSIPVWAIIVAIVGLFVVCVFSLLFLLVKETTYEGTVQLTVRSGTQQYTTQVVVSHPSHVQHLHQQIAWLQSAAAR